MKQGLIWGCIADDFTGASDAASFFAKGGIKTVLFNGVPDEDEELEQCQAVVIALKTRTQETKSAVALTLLAASWLKAQGAQHLYVKYCSTFDSTPKGNIGPVMDALLDQYQVKYTILCPALPVNGRVVKDGHLYVNGIPLHESSMKNHPLTPMWDSDIAKLMEPQSKYSCMKLTTEELAHWTEKGEQKIQRYGRERDHFYVIPDYEKEEDAQLIADCFLELPILSGGSGILTELARRSAGSEAAEEVFETAVNGDAVLFAGSCSEMTRKQIAYAVCHGVKAIQMKPEALLAGTQSEADFWEFMEKNKGQPLLIYSSDEPENVQRIQKEGKEQIAELLEQTMAGLACRAVEAGYTRIVVAGGETSGAITKALAFHSYLIGESVAPGVPIMVPRNQKSIRLILKSGNFGAEDFFVRALQMTGTIK